MSRADTDFVPPKNIILDFDRDRLSPPDIKKAADFYWLQKHVRELAGNFSEAEIRVNQVRYSTEGKVRHLDVTGIYPDPIGRKNKIYYTVNADAVGVVSLFKLTGIELTGGPTERKEPSYAVLAVMEARIPLASSYTLGLPGGDLEPGETFQSGGRRELVEETIVNEKRYKMPPLETFEMLARFHPSLDATRTEGIVGVYSQLDWANPNERHFVRDLIAGKGGMTSENENTRPVFVSIDTLLKEPDMAPLFNTALATFTNRIAQRTGDHGPRLAYASAAQTLG